MGDAQTDSVALSCAVLVYIVQQKLDTVLFIVLSNDGTCLTGQRNRHPICQVVKVFSHSKGVITCGRFLSCLS